MNATARPRSAPRGLTLVELLISLLVGSIVIAGALALMVSQQRAFRSSTADRAMQDTARAGLEDLSVNLRRAGYGVEPWLAFDLGPVTNAPPSWPGGAALTTKGYPGGRPGTTPPACTATAAPTDRDRIDGPDEIVFLARDPAFNRQLAAAPSDHDLNLATPLKNSLEVGQILQVMCGAAAAWAYVTVGAHADPGATRVQLATTCTSGFPYQQSLLPAGCFTTFASVRVFKIDRFHYYVDRFQGRPYLMLDRGLWSDAGPLVEPVAPDVEDIQFAYLFPAAAAPLATIVGVTPGTQLTRSAEGIDLDAAPPGYDQPGTSVSRTTHHPANIRGVRASVVVRAPNADVQLTAAEFHTVPAAANRAAVTTADPNYRRLVVETTDGTRNLDSRGPLFPAYSTNGGADGLNVGGG